ncbi:hypothetical protein [Clostridium butyricum]|uniref:hypothetical protein n=1 Tax=Clostridium butyricum TaxID=1492 RepID=UPI002ABDA1B0|nr:hypothetical protein [Clostridium butyricum]
MTSVNYLNVQTVIMIALIKNIVEKGERIMIKEFKNWKSVKNCNFNNSVIYITNYFSWTR